MSGEKRTTSFILIIPKSLGSNHASSFPVAAAQDQVY
jgi:hypothetical protein